MTNYPDGPCPDPRFVPGFPGETPSPDDETLTAEELHESACAQAAEIDKYQWCLGVELGYDPLTVRTRTEIACEWIERYAAAFRAWWRSQRRR